MVDATKIVVNILIIEDSTVDRMLMIDQLMRIPDVTCQYASTWGTAFRMLSSAHVVIFDLGLPDIKTIDDAVQYVGLVAGTLRIPTIIWSGTDDPQVIARCQRFPKLVKYLAKDCSTPRQLREAVEEAITQTRFGQTDAMLEQMKTDSRIINPQSK